MTQVISPPKAEAMRPDGMRQASCSPHPWSAHLGSARLARWDLQNLLLQGASALVQVDVALLA